MDPSRVSDEHLLDGADRDPDGFGVFYARHERIVIGLDGTSCEEAATILDLPIGTIRVGHVAPGRS